LLFDAIEKETPKIMSNLKRERSGDDSDLNTYSVKRQRQEVHESPEINTKGVFDAVAGQLHRRTNTFGHLRTNEKTAKLVLSAMENKYNTNATSEDLKKMINRYIALFAKAAPDVSHQQIEHDIESITTTLLYHDVFSTQKNTGGPTQEGIVENMDTLFQYLLSLLVGHISQVIYHGSLLPTGTETIPHDAMFVAVVQLLQMYMDTETAFSCVEIAIEGCTSEYNKGQGQNGDFRIGPMALRRNTFRPLERITDKFNHLLAKVGIAPQTATVVAMVCMFSAALGWIAISRGSVHVQNLTMEMPSGLADALKATRKALAETLTGVAKYSRKLDNPLNRRFVSDAGDFLKNNRSARASGGMATGISSYDPVVDLDHIRSPYPAFYSHNGSTRAPTNLRRRLY
jgi:hypothetical protein